MFDNSLVMDPPGLGFNLDISSIASFKSSWDKLNFSESFENFFFENISNSFSKILIEFITDFFKLFFLLSWIKRHSFSDLAPTPAGSRSCIFSNIDNTSCFVATIFCVKAKSSIISSISLLNYPLSSILPI